MQYANQGMTISFSRDILVKFAQNGQTILVFFNANFSLDKIIIKIYKFIKLMNR